MLFEMILIRLMDEELVLLSKAAVIDLNTYLILQVEVKRAVPKAEIGGTPAVSSATGPKTAKPSPSSSPALTPLKKPSNQLATIALVTGSSPVKQTTSTATTQGTASISATPTKGIRSNSVTSTISNGTDDNRFNTEEYANNKIFVGGLHYDTRDGKSATFFFRD